MSTAVDGDSCEPVQEQLVMVGTCRAVSETQRVTGRAAAGGGSVLAGIHEFGVGGARRDEWGRVRRWSARQVMAREGLGASVGGSGWAVAWVGWACVVGVGGEIDSGGKRGSWIRWLVERCDRGRSGRVSRWAGGGRDGSRGLFFL